MFWFFSPQNRDSDLDNLKWCIADSIWSDFESVYHSLHSCVMNLKKKALHNMNFYSNYTKLYARLLVVCMYMKMNTEIISVQFVKSYIRIMYVLSPSERTNCIYNSIVGFIHCILVTVTTVLGFQASNIVALQRIFKMSSFMSWRWQPELFTDVIHLL